eukprot:766058-Hanusia_phi.AAC.7
MKELISKFGNSSQTANTAEVPQVSSSDDPIGDASVRNTSKAVESQAQTRTLDSPGVEIFGGSHRWTTG